MPALTDISRQWDQLRPVTIEPFPTAAPGSVLICQGQTRILCTAALTSPPPQWLPTDDTGNPVQGWVTAEYSMLPGSTIDRKRRGPDSRGTEIQRLIGRVLRAAVNLERMPGLAVTCDCDVLQADGGTRTAAITGAFVALSRVLAQARQQAMIDQDPVLGPVAAVSVGIVDGQPYLDLDYALDVRAQVDMNVAMNHEGQLIEVQGTAEQGVFDRSELDILLDLATTGIKQLIDVQDRVLQELVEG